MKGPENTASTSKSLETLTAVYSALANRTQRSAHGCKVYWYHIPPLRFSSKHNCRWETHLTCEIQVTLNYTAFSVSEISTSNKYQSTCLACAHLYVGCDTVLMSIPQKVCNRCRKSKVRYDTPKYPVYVLKSPWKGYPNNVQVPTLFNK